MVVVVVGGGVGATVVVTGGRAGKELLNRVFNWFPLTVAGLLLNDGIIYSKSTLLTRTHTGLYNQDNSKIILLTLNMKYIYVLII